MAHATTLNSSATLKSGRQQHLHIMVVQRLAAGVGPGPIHVVKKLLREVAVGSVVKQVRVPVYLDHTLPAGTGMLSELDRKTFAAEGLSEAEIAYIEAKLPGKKLQSDAHRCAFEAGKELRLRERLKERLVSQLLADGELAADVMAAVREGGTTEVVPTTTLSVASQRDATLSDKVSRLLALVNEVGRDIEAYRDGAKVGKRYDKDKLRAMLTKEAERDWNLSWFALSRMIDQATGTPFARPKGWASDKELSKLAAAHGYKPSSAAQ